MRKSKSGKSVMTSRALSVYPDTPATEVIEWLQKIWSGFSPAEREGATMEARHVGDMVMVGFRWQS